MGVWNVVVARGWTLRLSSLTARPKMERGPLSPTLQNTQSPKNRCIKGYSLDSLDCFEAKVAPPCSPI
jgi:hypothetical protein